MTRCELGCSGEGPDDTPRDASLVSDRHASRATAGSDRDPEHQPAVGAAGAAGRTAHAERSRRETDRARRFSLDPLSRRLLSAVAAGASLCRGDRETIARPSLDPVRQRPAAHRGSGDRASRPYPGQTRISPNCADSSSPRCRRGSWNRRGCTTRSRAENRRTRSWKPPRENGAI